MSVHSRDGEQVKLVIYRAAHMLLYGFLSHRDKGLNAEMGQLKDRSHS